MKPKVVIVGGGFAGLNAARGLAGAPVDLLLIDRTNHHAFQPLLYQVAAAALSPRDIARPLRDVLRYQSNASVVMADVVGFDVAQQRVLLADGDPVPYDYLIVAIGARHSYFGNHEWEQFAPGLKTVSDALELRRRILVEFEHAEREAIRHAPQQGVARDETNELTFVVVGAGPTGVEMAGAIAEIAKQTLRRNFRHIKPEMTRTLLIEAAPRVLPPFPEELSANAQRQLESLGVEVRCNTRVVRLADREVELQAGLSAPGRGDSPRDSPEEVVPTSEILTSNCTIWAAGNEVSDVLAQLPGERDRSGRLAVTEDLSLESAPNVFVLGDAALFAGPDGVPLAALAPVAMQQGKAAAANIRRSLRGDPRKPFSYWDRGTMATIGKARAVAWVGKLRFGGLLAWLAWSLVHILFLIGFRTKVVVMLEWLYLYLFNRRDARLLHVNADDHLDHSTDSPTGGS